MNYVVESAVKEKRHWECAFQILVLWPLLKTNIRCIRKAGKLYCPCRCAGSIKWIHGSVPKQLTWVKIRYRLLWDSSMPSLFFCEFPAYLGLACKLGWRAMSGNQQISETILLSHETGAMPCYAILCRQTARHSSTESSEPVRGMWIVRLSFRFHTRRDLSGENIGWFHTKSYKHWFCCFARSKDFVELFNGFVGFSFSLFHIFPEVYSKNAPHQLTLADWAHASEFAFDQGRWRLWECGVVEVAEASKFTVPMLYVFVYIFLCFLFQVGAFCSSSWRVRSFSPKHALGFWQICIAFCVQCTMFTEFLLTLALWRWATECCEYSTPLGSIVGKITDRLREFGAVHHIGPSWESKAIGLWGTPACLLPSDR